jgi:hypothetical protein
VSNVVGSGQSAYKNMGAVLSLRLQKRSTTHSGRDSDLE